MTENQITGKIVDASYEIHSSLGPGLLESVYEEILAYELRRRRVRFSRQASLRLKYKELQTPNAYRVDLIVEHKVIVDLKAIDAVSPAHKKQLLSYLKLADCRIGLLINFNTVLIKQGITRIVNDL